MWAFALVVAAGLSADTTFPVDFFRPDQLVDPRDVRLAPQPPSESFTLLTPEPERPSARYWPCSSYTTPRGTLLWYQKVENADEPGHTRCAIHLGVVSRGQWRLPFPKDPLLPSEEPCDLVMRDQTGQPIECGLGSCQVFRLGDRFHMLSRTSSDQGVTCFTSRDAMHWTPRDQASSPVVPHTPFTVMALDGQLLLYSSVRHASEKPDAAGRASGDVPATSVSISVQTSRDLETWEAPTTAIQPDQEDEDSLHAFKVFPFRDLYVGLLQKRRREPEDRRSEREHSTWATEVALSRDGLRWQRPFRHDDLGFWTPADPFMDEGKLCFPVARDRSLQVLACPSRRLFGVVSLGGGEGEFVTQVLTMPDADVALDADARTGWIEVELLDSGGDALGGQGPCRIEGVVGEQLRLEWHGLGTLDFQLQEGRMRFRIYRAVLYGITTVPD